MGSQECHQNVTLGSQLGGSSVLGNSSRPGGRAGVTDTVHLRVGFPTPRQVERGGPCPWWVASGENVHWGETRERTTPGKASLKNPGLGDAGVWGVSEVGCLGRFQ